MTKDERLLYCTVKHLPEIEHKLVKAAKALAILHQELQEAERAQKLAATLTDNRSSLPTLVKKERLQLESTKTLNELRLIDLRRAHSNLKYSVRQAQKEVSIARKNFCASMRKALKDVPAMESVFVLSDMERSDVWQEKLDKLNELQDKYLENSAQIAALSSNAFELSSQFFANARKKRQSALVVQQEAKAHYEQAKAKYQYALRGYDYFREHVRVFRTLSRPLDVREIILDELHKADIAGYLLDHANEYPGIEKWIDSIRHNSILRISSKHNTFQVYYGGTRCPDDYNHGHVATPLRKDGTINPAAKPYFRPPNQRGRA